MHFDFDACEAYELLDSRKVQQVDSYDIVNYLRSNYVDCQLDTAEFIVMAHS